MALGRVFSTGTGLETDNFPECDVGTALWSNRKAAEPMGAGGPGEVFHSQAAQQELLKR